MEAYGEYLVTLANARLDELRREAAQQRLAHSLDGRRRRGWRLFRRRRPLRPRPAVSLPVRAEQPSPAELRRSA
ncbi:MAG: hypothetical protein ACLGI2_16615 [Acidimicrobiia bacterium]